MKISKVKSRFLTIFVMILLIEGVSFASYQINAITEEKTKEKYIINEDEEVSLNEEESEVLKLINQYRIENGLEELKVYNRLQEVAKIKALDIVKNSYFSHNSETFRNTI